METTPAKIMKEYVNSQKFNSTTEDTNDNSLKKLLYLASKKIVERWTGRCRNWDVVLNQSNIMFQDRIAS